MEDEISAFAVCNNPDNFQRREEDRGKELRSIRVIISASLFANFRISALH